MSLVGLEVTEEGNVRRLTAAIRVFAEAMASEFDRDALLDELTHQTVKVVGADGAGIMLPGADGELRFAAASDERVERVEQEQALRQQGACHEAYTTRSVVAIGDLATEERWPEYLERCEEEGLRAVVGVPLVVADDLVGVINVYRERPQAWSEVDIDVVAAMGSMGAAYVLNASRRTAADDLTAQLQHALDARVVIEQAKGYVMASDGLDERDAFERLRTEARNSSRKLREVAQQVIERTTTG